MSQIVCLSDTPWSDGAGRLRQLAERMPKHRILFFDPRPKGRVRDNVHVTTYRDEGQQVTKWITSYASPPEHPGLPAPLQKMSERKMATYVRQRISEVGFVNPVLWAGDPKYAYLLEHIPHSLSVLDVPPEACRDAEEAARCAARFGAVVCRSREIAGRLKLEDGQAYMVPNGVDFAHFHRAATDDLPFPNALFNVKNPMLGMVGRLTPDIEWGFLAHAARSHPEWSFVLVGEKDERLDLSALAGLENVHLAGHVDSRQLPGFLRRFDVCLSLRKNSPESLWASPSVLYEYLSAGKPVVSTPHPARTLDYTDVIYLAGSAEEFTGLCKKALAERDAWKVRQRISYGGAASWDARALEMERIFREKGAV